MNTTFDFSFLEDNFVYKFLTRGNPMLSLKNIEFLMNHEELEAYLDTPEISEKTLLRFWNNFEVVQDGEKVEDLADFQPHNESLALYPLENGHKDVFLVRAS